MNWLLLQNSLLVATLTTLVTSFVGFAAALCCSGLSPRMRKLVLVLAVVAFALPPFLVTNCWLHLLGHTGVWREWLPWDIYSLSGAVWLLALLLWPITTFFTLGAWERLQTVHLHSDPQMRGARLVGGLLLPLARPALAQAAVLTFVIALNEFAVPAILQVKTWPAELWVNFNTTFDYAAALRVSLPMVVFPAALLLWLSRRELGWPRVDSPAEPDLFRQQLGPALAKLSAGVTVLILGLSVALPLAELTTNARTWTELPGAMAAGSGAIWNSFWLAAVSATLCLVVGSMSLLGGAFVKFVGWASWLPLLVPGVLLGIVIIGAFNRPLIVAFYQSFGVVVLGFAVRYLALGWHGVAQAWRSLDRDLVDAARSCGARGGRLFASVIWPQAAPQLAAAWYVIYVLCLWDAETIVLIVPPGGETLALRIFNLLHYGHNAQVDALCLLLLALAIAPLAVWKIGSRVLRLFASRNVKTVALVAVSCVGLAGCGGRSESAASIQSELFERVEIVGVRGTGPGQFNKPRSVAVDREDNLYVADMTGRVQKFSPDGRFLLLWQMEETDKGKPKGMCCDERGNIVVVEPHYSRVNHFSSDGKLAYRWGEHGTNEGQLYFPRAAAVNARGDIIVSEYGVRERLQRFTAQGGKLLSSIGRLGTSEGEFDRAEGICVDRDGQVYVADSCNHRVQVFSDDLKFLRTFGRAGQGSGELSYPYDIQVDASGLIFVCEFGNSRVQVFDARGKTKELIGKAGSAPGEFSNPWGIALDSHGNLFVADSQNHRVQKFLRRVAPASGGSVSASHRNAKELEAQFIPTGAEQLSLFASRGFRREAGSDPRDAGATR